MDFDYQGRPDLAAFTSRMAAALGDEGLLRWLISTSATGHTFAGRLRRFRDWAIPGSEETANLEGEAVLSTCSSVRRRRLAADGRDRHGSHRVGKEHIGEMLGRELDWKVFSSDVLRKRLARVPLHRRVVNAMRRRLYAEEMTEKTYEALLQDAVEQARNRRSVILDATYSRRRHRDRLRRKLEAVGVMFRFVEARATDDAVRRRLKERDGKAGEISDARIEDFEVLSESYEPPSELLRANSCQSTPRKFPRRDGNRGSESVGHSLCDALDERRIVEVRLEAKIARLQIAVRLTSCNRVRSRWTKLLQILQRFERTIGRHDCVVPIFMPTRLSNFLVAERGIKRRND